jgi:hypothetical protein
MNLLIAGAAVLIVTVLAFMALMPRGGRLHRFVDTELEPYVAVALTALSRSPSPCFSRARSTTLADA